MARLLRLLRSAGVRRRPLIWPLPALLGVLVAVGACARQGVPPGGPGDRTPPAVVAVTPAKESTVEEMPDKIVFRFSERISERPSNGVMNDAVEISPMTGEVRVKHSRESLEVTLGGGFQPGLVYRATVRPVVQDMFQNRMRAPFELVFSTGAALDPTVLAGTAVDRLTLDTQDPTRVNAVLMDDPDGPAHTALADTGSVFALRFIPPGIYRVTAFQDVNRDRVPDPFESQSSVVANVSESDTVFLNFRTLVPDTTAAILARVEIIDSIRLSLAFDDFMDPEWEPTLVRVTLADSVVLDSLGVPIPEADTLVPDSLRGAPLPQVGAILHPFQVSDFMRARNDSISTLLREQALVDAMESQDSAAVDAANRAIVRAREAADAAAQEPPEPVEEPLPVQELVAVLSGPLPPGALVRIDVAEVRNISGLSGGGGTLGLRVPVPEPDTAAADSLAGAGGVLPTDSAAQVAPLPAAVPDTLVPDTLVPDTLVADTLLPDTLSAPPPGDTIRPDTLVEAAVSPDTVRRDTLPRDTIPPDTVFLRRRLPAPRPTQLRTRPSAGFSPRVSRDGAIRPRWLRSR